MNTNVVCCLTLFMTLPMLAGCPSGSEMDLEPVTGTVTFNGKPIEVGRIQFRSISGDQRSFSGVIEDGKYAVETATGPMQVAVRASRLKAGKFDESNPGEKSPMGEMYIPQKYNSRSELTAEVPEGGNALDFDLIDSK